MIRLFKTPLVLEPQKEGGLTVTYPVLPELITEVDDFKKITGCYFRCHNYCY